jgi:hypothetical protein
MVKYKFLIFIFFIEFLSTVHAQNCTQININSEQEYICCINSISKSDYQQAKIKSLELVEDKKIIQGSDEKVLKVNTRDTVLAFYNNEEDDSRQRLYLPLGKFSNSNLFLVKVCLYESNEYLLINTLSGLVYKCFGFPQLSENAEYVFSYFYSFSGIGEDIVQLVCSRNSKFFVLFEKKPTQYQIIDAKWINTGTLFVYAIVNIDDKNQKELFFSIQLQRT